MRQDTLIDTCNFDRDNIVFCLDSGFALFSLEVHGQLLFLATNTDLYVLSATGCSVLLAFSRSNGPITSLIVGALARQDENQNDNRPRFDCIYWCLKPLIPGLATKGALSLYVTGSNQEPPRLACSSRRLHEGHQCPVSRIRAGPIFIGVGVDIGHRGKILDASFRQVRVVSRRSAISKITPHISQHHGVDG